MHKYKKYGIIIKFTACFFGKLGGRVLVMRKNVQNLRPSEHLRMGLIAFLVGIFVPISGFYMEVLVVCVLFVVAAVIFRKYPFVVLAIFCFAIFFEGVPGWAPLAPWGWGGGGGEGLYRFFPEKKTKLYTHILTKF